VSRAVGNSALMVVTPVFVAVLLFLPCCIRRRFTSQDSRSSRSSSSRSSTGSPGPFSRPYGFLDGSRRRRSEVESQFGLVRPAHPGLDSVVRGGHLGARPRTTLSKAVINATHHGNTKECGRLLNRDLRSTDQQERRDARTLREFNSFAFADQGSAVAGPVIHAGIHGGELNEVSVVNWTFSTCGSLREWDEEDRAAGDIGEQPSASQRRGTGSPG